MSGGSFGYLSETGSLADLLTARDDLSGSAAALRARGLTLAANETEALITELASIEAYVLRRVERLRGVWKAVEWTVSGDWSEEDLAEEAAAFKSVPDSIIPRIDSATGRITT